MRNSISLLYALLFAIAGLAIAILVVVSSPHKACVPAAAPAAEPAASNVCDWCADLGGRMSPAERQSEHQSPVDCRPLHQRDFAAGTFIANVPGACYRLAEDIVFSPSPGTDWRAVDAPYASDPTFVLDFPATILVRASGVTIDLAGHEIRQSRAHYMQQRFFAHIELSTPFVPKQGPADFTRDRAVPEASRFTLRNGRLGLSSHHGIHGNGGWSVLVEGVDIADYEVAAVALNGVQDLVLRRVRALGTFRRVPVLSTYSSARFVMPFARRALAAGRSASRDDAAAVSRATDALALAAGGLQRLMDEALADVVRSGAIDAAQHPHAYALFGNPTGLPDGSASYGFIVHNHGVAINGFECDPADPRNDRLHHVLIEDCEVRDTLLHAVEVPALQEVASGKLQRGPAGDLLSIAAAVDADGRSYAGTPLTEVVIALADLVAALRLPGFGTLAVSPTVVRWARAGTSSGSESDAGALASAVAGGAFRYLRNGDSMFHVNKGAFGIHIGGGHHIAVRRTSVAGVASTGAPANFAPLPGETAASAYWVSGRDGGHPGAGPQHGYGGADAAGVAIAAAAEVLLDAVTVRNVHARAGWASALYVFNGASGVHVNDLGIFNVTAMTDPALRVAGPKQPRAVGTSVTTDADPPVFTGTLEIAGVGAGRIGMACNSLVENAGVDSCSFAETNFYSM